MGNIEWIKKWIAYVMAGMILFTSGSSTYASDLKQEEDVLKSEQSTQENIQEETKPNTENMFEADGQTMEGTETLQTQVDTEQFNETEQPSETDTESSNNASTETIEKSMETAIPTEENEDMLEESTSELSVGNSMSIATNIALNGNYSGSFSTDNNRRHFYKTAVSGNSSVCLNIRIIQYFSSLDLRVYDSNGNKIIDKSVFWNSNLGQGTNDIVCYLNPGTYYIEMYAYSSGNYTMQLSYTAMGNLDTAYDDTIVAAHSISLTTSFTGVMAHGEDSDIYRLDVARPGIINCKFNAYMVYIYLKLLDKDGNTLWSYNPCWNNNIGYSTNDYKLSLEKGTYYLQVYKDGSNTGRYTMQNVFTDVGSNEIEDNDTIAAANSIAFEQTYNGLLGDGEISDFYRFVLPQDAEIRVNYTAHMLYVYLKLYDMYGNEIASYNPRWNENLGYSSNVYAFELPAGTYHLQVCADGGNRGNYQFSVKIPLSIVNASISCASSKVYTGKEIRPGVTVTYGGRRLSQNIDYTVEYSDNYWIGKATVKVTGMGNYVGEKIKTFKIVPKKVKLTSLKNKKNRKMYVYWKPDSSVDGFQICYSTSKKFKGAKKANVSRSRAYYNYKSYYKVISKLKKNKKYYVKVRAYGYADGKKIYGAYSNVKTVKIRK